MIKIFDKNETNFNTNGLAILNRNTKKATIKRKLNADYYLEMEYLSNKKYDKYLVQQNILQANNQLFRIYKVKKNSNTQIYYIYAKHIFYDLDNYFIEDTRAVNSNCALALTRALADTPFSSTSNILNQHTKYFIEQSALKSVFEVVNEWDGELERDNFNVEIKDKIGINSNISIRQNKNLEGIEVTADITDTITRIYAVGKDGLKLTEKYVVSDNYSNFQRTKKVTFGNAETKEQLREQATEYLSKVENPTISYKVDIIELSCTEEYKQFKFMERINLGDYIQLNYSDYGINNAYIKVIEIEHDVLAKQNTKILLANSLDNVFSVLAKTQNTAKTVSELIDNEGMIRTDKMAAIINLATTAIRSNDGHVLLKDNSILIMDTTDETTAEKVWRWSVGGLGYSSNGVNGDYETAITSDGMIVADFVATGKIVGGYMTIDLNAGTLLIGESTENYLFYFDGTNLKLGANVAIDWNQIENKPDIKGYTDEEALNAWANSGYATYINANGIYTGTMTTKKLVGYNGYTFAEVKDDSYGGKMYVYDSNGYLNAKIGTENGTGGNVGGTLILYKDAVEGAENSAKRVSLGISCSDGGGIVNVADNSGKDRVVMRGGLIPNVGVANTSGQVVSYLSETEGRINNYKIATEYYVNNKVQNSSVFKLFFESGGNIYMRADSVVEFNLPNGSRYQLYNNGVMWFYNSSNGSWIQIAP